MASWMAQALRANRVESKWWDFLPTPLMRYDGRKSASSGKQVVRGGAGRPQRQAGRDCPYGDGSHARPLPQPPDRILQPGQLPE